MVYYVVSHLELLTTEMRTTKLPQEHDKCDEFSLAYGVNAYCSVYCVLIRPWCPGNKNFVTIIKLKLFVFYGFFKVKFIKLAKVAYVMHEADHACFT